MGKGNDPLSRFAAVMLDVLKEFDPGDDAPTEKPTCDHAALVEDAVAARRALLELTHHHTSDVRREMSLTELAKIAGAMYDAKKRTATDLKRDLDEHRAHPSEPHVTESQLESLARVAYSQIWDVVETEVQQTLRDAFRQELFDLGISAIR